jgi:hypothetical protein
MQQAASIPIHRTRHPRADAWNKMEQNGTLFGLNVI